MIQYRKATADDIPDLVELRVDLLKEVAQEDRNGAALKQRLVEYFHEHLPKGDLVIWLALDQGKIVAIGAVCFYSLPPSFINTTGNRAYILNVYTLQPYRRKGISKRIFELLMQEAQERNVSVVSLHASEDGRPMYEQFGFKPKGNEMTWQAPID